MKAGIQDGYSYRKEAVFESVCFSFNAAVAHIRGWQVKQVEARVWTAFEQEHVSVVQLTPKQTQRNHAVPLLLFCVPEGEGKFYSIVG